MESLYNASLTITKKTVVRTGIKRKDPDGIFSEDDDGEDFNLVVEEATVGNLKESSDLDISFSIVDEERLRESSLRDATALAVISTGGLLEEDGPPATKKAKGYAKCEHGKQKAYCKDCGGSRICHHGKQRACCRDCG